MVAFSSSDIVVFSCTERPTKKSLEFKNTFAFTHSEYVKFFVEAVLIKKNGLKMKLAIIVQCYCYSSPFFSPDDPSANLPVHG